MATGGLTPLRSNNSYVGAAKQAAWGTAVPPTWFWLFGDGTAADLDAKMQTEREGDTGPHINLMWKSEEHAVIKIVEKVRPITAGYTLQNLLGTGSDTFTAATQTTTVAGAGAAAGGTTIVLTASIGNVGTLAIAVNPGLGNATFEVVTLDLTSRTGTGPYTYTVAASGTFLNAHTAGEAVRSLSKHVFKRATGNSTFDPCTIEVGLGTQGSAPFQAMRYVNACCADLKLHSEKGGVVHMEHTWYASSALLQATLATPVFESFNVVGRPGAPFRHSMASGAWTVDGATTGNAATVERFTLNCKNSTTPDEYFSEGLNPVYFTPDDFEVSGELQVQFQSFSHYYETYFGSTTPAAAAADSPLVGYGSVNVTWTMDVIDSLQCNLPNVGYTAAKVPFAAKGHAVVQNIMFTGIKNAGNPDPLIITLQNTQNTTY